MLRQVVRACARGAQRGAAAPLVASSGRPPLTTPTSARVGAFPRWLSARGAGDGETKGDGSHMVWPPPLGVLESNNPVAAQAVKEYFDRQGGEQVDDEEWDAGDEDEDPDAVDDVDDAALFEQKAQNMKVVLEMLNDVLPRADRKPHALIQRYSLTKLKVQDLRDIAQRIGVATNGTKPQLASRIWVEVEPEASGYPLNEGLGKKGKPVGNYPVGLKKGSRGEALEGGWEDWHKVEVDDVYEGPTPPARRPRSATAAGGDAAAGGAVQVSQPPRQRGEGLKMAKGEAVEPRAYAIAVSPEEVGSLLHKARITNVLLLHLDTSLSHFTSAFVIGTGRSPRHLYSAANAVVYLVKQRCGEAHFPHSCAVNGTPDSQWIAVDAGSVVVHLFTQDEREHYNLEELWEPRASKVQWLQDPVTPDTIATATITPKARPGSH